MFLFPVPLIGIGAAAVNAETIAWAAAVFSVDATVVPDARKRIVSDLIDNLKDSGIWSKLDRLWLFAAATQTEAKVDLVVNDIATLSGSPSFSADDGYTGNTGSSAYIDSTYNPTTDAINYAQSSACIFGWSNTSGTETGALVGIPTGNVTRIYPAYTDNMTYWGVNSNGSETSALGGTGDTGLWHANRSSFSNQELYLNGSLLVSPGTRDSTALISQNIRGLSEAGGGFSNRQICCMGFGGNLNSTEANNLYLSLRSYMTLVGVP